MELAKVLPILILNSELSVTTDEMNIINDVFSCNIEFCSKSKYLLQSASINKNSKTNVRSKESWCDIFRFEHAYKTLKILNKCVDTLHTNPPCKHYISMTSALFLYHICYFLEYVLRRMYLTPEQERNKELNYRKLWHCQRKSVEDVTKSTTDLEEQRINHKKMLADTIKQYEKNIVTINEIDKRCNEYITSTNVRYEKKQIVICKAWIYEQSNIQSALKNIIDDFESLKDINMKKEQTICKRKLITESKLLTIITKYDTEIGNRCKMLEQLSEIYKYHKLEKYDLEKEMKQQEKGYLVFIKQKEKIGE
ncbi:hypothetical protein ALC56_02076 [Trachymyrmex septentrionalis]|uniref:Dynein regulatory complex protein 10 n=1 Tax=Trachymyrmex septentrionalis TaxID=34720 RepID=A0A195FRW6_9HYME|nr:PREDICTED: uncharacterized protein LOC108756983 [Trachymyrmex septentrionalis]KYN43350.1 hypothetical protein ALC56_02076 [Trachymyrmex septentrionalis]